VGTAITAAVVVGIDVGEAVAPPQDPTNKADTRTAASDRRIVTASPQIRVALDIVAHP